MRPSVEIIKYALDCIGTNYKIDDYIHIIIQAVINTLGKSDGRSIFLDFMIKHHTEWEQPWASYDAYKKNNKTDDDYYNFRDIVDLAKPFDTKELLLTKKEQENKDKKLKLEEKEEYYLNDDEYRGMKIKFEKYNFKMDDKYYNVNGTRINHYHTKNFEELHRELHMENGDKFVKVWLEDDNKRIVNNIDFLPPPLEVDDDTFNTYDILPKVDYSDFDVNTDIDYITKFIYNLCGKDNTMFNYFIKYLAHLVKYPAVKPEVAFFFSSGQGAGKDTLATLLTKLLIDKVLLVNDPEYAFGKYNLQRMNKLVLILQEADNMKKWNNKIKDTITCTTTNLANKGLNAITVKDYTRLIVFSNNINIIKIDSDDRRWVIPDVYSYELDTVEEKKEFFTNVYSQINNDRCVNKFYHFLNTYDVNESFDFQTNRPKNELYYEIKKVDTPLVVRWLYETFKDVSSEKPIKFSGKQIELSYNEFIKDNYDTNTKVSIAQIGLYLRKYFCVNKNWYYGLTKHKSNLMSYEIEPAKIIKYITNKYFNETL